MIDAILLRRTGAFISFFNKFFYTSCTRITDTRLVTEYKVYKYFSGATSFLLNTLGIRNRVKIKKDDRTVVLLNSYYYLLNTIY